MTSVIYLTLILLLAFTSMVRTKTCSVLENMICECHSSLNNDTESLTCTNHFQPFNSSIQLTNISLQNPRTFDSFHLTFHTKEFNITAMFVNQLSYLFPRSFMLSGRQLGKIKIILTFQDYQKLHFEDYSFYQLFGEKSDFTTSLSLELTASGQISFSPMAFNQLTVDQLSLHSSSLEPYSFEEIFNNTNIGNLALEGCTPRSNTTLRQYFNGKIRSAKFTKMAEIVSSEEFPRYPVGSMIIESHEPRKLNASTFMNYYNLHGVHLIRPRFFFDNRSFDGFQYLQNLETIELDAETIKDHTFQHAARIRFFTLGQNVRYLSEHSFDHLDYLTRFDLSKVILDQLYPSAKCILARYLQKQQRINPAMIILPPQAEFCDCIYDYILNLIGKKADSSYMDLCQNTQQERCQLSECEIVRNIRLPMKDNPPIQQVIPSIDGSLHDTPISLYPIYDQIQPTTPARLPSYIPRRPPVYHGSETNHRDNGDDETSGIGSSYADTQDSSHASSFKANKPIDPNAIPTDHDNDEIIHSPSAIHKSQFISSNNDEHYRMKRNNRTLKWISFSLIGITMLSIIVVGSIIWFFTSRRRKAGFQPVPPNAANV